MWDDVALSTHSRNQGRKVFKCFQSQLEEALKIILLESPHMKKSCSGWNGGESCRISLAQALHFFLFPWDGPRNLWGTLRKWLIWTSGQKMPPVGHILPTTCFWIKLYWSIAIHTRCLHSCYSSRVKLWHGLWRQQGENISFLVLYRSWLNSNLLIV